MGKWKATSSSLGVVAVFVVINYLATSLPGWLWILTGLMVTTGVVADLMRMRVES